MVNYSNQPQNYWLCKNTGVYGFLLLGHFFVPKWLLKFLVKVYYSD